MNVGSVINFVKVTLTYLCARTAAITENPDTELSLVARLAA